MLDDDHLTQTVRDTIRISNNTVYVSPISLYEIGLKHSLGKLHLPESPKTMVPLMRKRHALASLPFDEPAAARISDLPFFHKDPFDRMLVCQAQAHNLTILTPDPFISQYNVETAW